jgi:2-C-methyl-D-erythritol 2,4-cyclodiphosphate synthase
MIRVGIGYDSHRFAAGRPLVLGGITIPDAMGLAGHSDGDAVAHAIADAMLGALGLGDLGHFFPDTDPRYRDADSMGLLERVRTRSREVGWVVHNIDATIITEAPRLAPHLQAMRERLASALDADVAAVSLKAKTNEGMGFIGQGEGLAVIAIAALQPA